jgi:hypothetical protein
LGQNLQNKKGKRLEFFVFFSVDSTKKRKEDFLGGKTRKTKTRKGWKFLYFLV